MAKNWRRRLWMAPLALKIVTVVNFDKVSFEMNDILRVFHFNSKWRVSLIFTDCFVFFQIEKKLLLNKVLLE